MTADMAGLRREFTPRQGVPLSRIAAPPGGHDDDDPPPELTGSILAQLARIDSRLGALEEAEMARAGEALRAAWTVGRWLLIPAILALLSAGGLLAQMRQIQADIADVHADVRGHAQAIGEMRTQSAVMAGRIDDLRDAIKRGRTGE
ncbi:MAG: hypothetical protein ACRCU1_00380 [Alsobacter sp.]